MIKCTAIQLKMKNLRSIVINFIFISIMLLLNLFGIISSFKQL